MIRRASAECRAVSHPTSDVDEAVCWECGAPANPACARTVVLRAWAGEHKDGQGYPVDHSHFEDRVRVPVPRCEGCRNRYRLAMFLSVTGGLVGLVTGGVASSWGAITMFTGLLGSWTFSLPFFLYERHSGWRSHDTWPPLQRLRQAGWKDVRYGGGTP